MGDTTKTRRTDRIKVVADACIVGTADWTEAIVARDTFADLRIVAHIY